MIGIPLCGPSNMQIQCEAGKVYIQDPESLGAYGGCSSDTVGYGFPPLQLPAHLLHRIQIKGILIALAWPRRTWYSGMVGMSSEEP